MAKTRAYGADARLIAAFEATYGTAPATGWFALPFKRITLGAEKPLGYDPLLGQGRDAQDPYYEGVSVAGDIGVPIDVRAVGFWLKGLFGAPVTTGTGPYTHVFTSGGDLPSLALELGFTGFATPSYEKKLGVKLGELSFEMQRSGPAEATISAIAQGETVGAVTASAAPENFALARFSNSGGEIRQGGTFMANVTGGSFKFSNHLEAVETIRSDGLIDGIDETEATAEGSVTLRLGADTTLDDAALAETPLTLSYGFTKGAHSLTFALPRVFFPRKKREVSGPGGVVATYEWRAAFDPTADHLLAVTLVNDVESY